MPGNHDKTLLLTGLPPLLFLFESEVFALIYENVYTFNEIKYR